MPRSAVLHSSLTKETAVIHAAGAEEEKVGVVLYRTNLPTIGINNNSFVSFLNNSLHDISSGLQINLHLFRTMLSQSWL